jgi:hypothetical protein
MVNNMIYLHVSGLRDKLRKDRKDLGNIGVLCWFAKTSPNTE